MPFSASPGAKPAHTTTQGASHLECRRCLPLTQGWRLSLGLAGVPACVLLLGGLLLPESPNSLIER